MDTLETARVETFYGSKCNIQLIVVFKNKNSSKMVIKDWQGYKVLSANEDKKGIYWEVINHYKEYGDIPFADLNKCL